MTARLDSHALKLFLAVADAASFRQAAEALHLSQPPLSRAIAALESSLGVRLFERHVRGVALTEAGRRLEPHARSVMDALRQAEAAMTAPQSITRLRLGLTSAVQPVWFAQVLDRLTARLPELAVTTHSDSSPALVRMLRASRLDAAFIALPTETGGLLVEPIERHPMIVALNASHRLARRRRISLLDLQTETLLWFERSRQPAFHDYCGSVFASHGFAPRTLREPADHHVLLAEVASGRGVSLLPDSFMTIRRAGVVYRPLVEGDEMAVGVGLALSPDRQALRDLLLASVSG
ncbi:LysR family transcriptional regulator [soil metagenome]